MEVVRDKTTAACRSALSASMQWASPSDPVATRTSNADGKKYQIILNTSCLCCEIALKPVVSNIRLRWAQRAYCIEITRACPSCWRWHGGESWRWVPFTTKLMTACGRLSSRADPSSCSRQILALAFEKPPGPSDPSR